MSRRRERRRSPGAIRLRGARWLSSHGFARVFVPALLELGGVIENSPNLVFGKISFLEKIFHGSDFLYKLELTKDETVFCYTSSHHNHAINEVIGIKPEIDHLIIFDC